MKQFHLYKIGESYLYVLQTIDNKKGIDILAIREDTPNIIFPMYSPTFKNYEDLGIPSIDKLKSINPYFLMSIQVSQILCGVLQDMTNNNLRDYIKTQIMQLHISNFTSICTNTDLLTMSINRSLPQFSGALKKYVKNRIHSTESNETDTRD